MKKLFIAFLSIVSLSACSHFKPDYDVTDASDDSRPKWLKQIDAEESDRAENRKSYRYYVDEAEHKDQRLCLKNAETRAIARVGSEVSQNILNKFEENSKSTDDNVTRVIQEQLRQSVDTMLHGVSRSNQYWEKRHYREDLGAETERRVFNCNVAVRIERKVLTEELNSYKARTLRMVDKEYKEPLEKAVDAEIQKTSASGE